MCRYGHTDYMTHWACLQCRWTAKHPVYVEPRCPRCRVPMLNLGRDFHAPRREAERQWRKVGLLVDAGITFDSCGCRGPGPRPRTLADAVSDLQLRRKARRRGPSV